MNNVFLVALLFLIPLTGSAATFIADKTVVLSSSPEENVYLSGTTIRVTAPIPADLIAAGGTMVVSGPVSGDALLAGGTVSVSGDVAGDVRALAGHLIIEGTVAGDVIGAGGAVSILAPVGDTHIAGGTVDVQEGATGAVTIYGASVKLSGEFAGDVEVIASDSVSLGEGTYIRGSLKYNAPQEAAIPPSAIIDGDVIYTGSSTFLPTVEEAKTFAIAGAGVFIIVGLISTLLAVALVAGLFPAFTQAVLERSLFSGIRKFLLLFLLGFAILVATPVLLLLLTVSFVGVGVALVIGSAYLLLLSLSYLYAGVLAGGALARGLFKRSLVSWKFAVLGMLALSLVSVVPAFGTLVVFILTATAAGTISSFAFSFAFPKSDAEAEA
jgi:cytoskeletal protein CcmA (bactofilin family)